MEPPNTPPSRRSGRLAAKKSEAEQSPQTSSMETFRAPSEISAASTEILDDDISNLLKSAKDRIKAYSLKTKDDKYLSSCLNAFLEHLSEPGARSIANDVLRCGEDDRTLFEVFDNLRTTLLGPMLSTSGRPSTTQSPHPKRHEQKTEFIAQNPPEPLKREELFRERCLKRDDYRCLVTGVIHVEHFEVPEGAAADAEFHVAPVEAAHIIPFSYASYKDTDSPPDHISQRWETLYRCFPVLEKRIDLSAVIDVSNSISLAADLHTEFGKMRMAFQETDEPHTYRIKTYPKFTVFGRSLLPKDGIVKVDRENRDPTLPLPDPELLKVHATVADILFASGMGEAIEKAPRDLDRIGCLQEDGSTDVEFFLNTALSVA